MISFLSDTDYPLLLVRPFLEVPKWKLEAACTEQALTWADDPTNRDTKYLRNHMRSLLSKTITHAQSQLPLSGFAPRSQPADAHRQQFVDKAMHVPEEEHQVSSQASQGEGQLDAAEQQLGEVNIIPAILRVHSRCAAAHYTVSSQVKDLLQASLNLSRQTDQQQKRRKRHEPGHQTGTEWSLAVKPFAEAQPAVALHALTAVMQVVFILLCVICTAIQPSHAGLLPWLIKNCMTHLLELAACLAQCMHLVGSSSSSDELLAPVAVLLHSQSKVHDQVWLPAQSSMLHCRLCL